MHMCVCARSVDVNRMRMSRPSQLERAGRPGRQRGVQVMGLAPRRWLATPSVGTAHVDEARRSAVLDQRTLTNIQLMRPVSRIAIGNDDQ